MQRLVCYIYYELTKQESSGHQPVYLATLEEFSYKLGTLFLYDRRNKCSEALGHPPIKDL